MKTRLLLFVALLLTCSSVGWSFFQVVLAHHGAQMTQSANRLLDSLDAEQQKQMQLEFESKERVAWHFIPKPDRKGVQLADMTDAQRAEAHELLRSALSQIGYKQTTQIMELEKLLAVLEQDRENGAIRDPLRYYVSIFGEPGSSEQWGLSFEGHHVSLNFVIEGDRVVSSTPQFLGTAPAIVQEDRAGFKKGHQILREEEALGFQMIRALSPEQQQQAIIAEKAPGDVRSGGDAQPPTAPAEGVAYAELEEEEQTLLRRIVGVYADKMAERIAAKRIEAIEKAGWDEVHFAWAGAQQPGIGHYYRIQGPSFLIEFNNSAPDSAGNPANHVHTLWRDMQGDFGLPVDQERPVAKN